MQYVQNEIGHYNTGRRVKSDLLQLYAAITLFWHLTGNRLLLCSQDFNMMENFQGSIDWMLSKTYTQSIDCSLYMLELTPQNFTS